MITAQKLADVYAKYSVAREENFPAKIYVEGNSEGVYVRVLI